MARKVLLSVMICGSLLIASQANAVPNYGLAFDGVSSYIDVTTNPASSLTSNLTLEAWALSTTSTAAHRILSCAGTTDPLVAAFKTGWGFGVRDRKWRITTYGVKDYDTTANSVALNTWTHIAVTLDSANTATFYINGNYAMAVTHTKPCELSTASLTVGCNVTSAGLLTELWQGRLDDIRVWDHVRTESQIRDNRNSALVGNETGLLLYLPFDEFTGTTTADKTGKSTGTPTLHNTIWALGAPFPQTRASDWSLYQ